MCTTTHFFLSRVPLLSPPFLTRAHEKKGRATTSFVVVVLVVVVVVVKVVVKGGTYVKAVGTEKVIFATFLSHSSFPFSFFFFFFWSDEVSNVKNSFYCWREKKRDFDENLFDATS